MISSANKDALESGHSGKIYFLWLDFADDALRACTGTRNYTTLAQTWLGIGEITGISDIAEAADIAARPLTITLSGDAFITEPLLSRTNYKGRRAVLYRGLLNADETLKDAPFPIWTGQMDVGSLIEGEVTAAQIVCEPLSARLLRPNISRYSDQDHQTRWPGDLFFEYLPQMAAKDVMWGGMRVSPSSGLLGSDRDLYGPGVIRSDEN